MPLTKSEQKRVAELLKVETKKINKHVSVNYDSQFIEIVNLRGGLQWVMLKQKTFEKIAKELGYKK